MWLNNVKDLFWNLLKDLDYIIKILQINYDFVKGNNICCVSLFRLGVDRFLFLFNVKINN